MPVTTINNLKSMTGQNIKHCVLFALSLSVAAVFLIGLNTGFASAELLNGTDGTWCYDTDGNGGYQTKGYCHDNIGNYTDFCNGGTVRDYYCTGSWNGSAWSNVRCDNGGYDCVSFGMVCSDGACISNTTSCTPATCTSMNKQCGSWPNNCNGTLNCGTCASGYNCDNYGQCVANPTSNSSNYTNNNPPSITFAQYTASTTGLTYTFFVTATDPDNDSIKYNFEWSDGTVSPTEFVQSGTQVSRSYAWAYSGNYNVKVTAIDSKGAASIPYIFTIFVKSQYYNTTCPQYYTCPSGSTVSCYISNNACQCGQCPNVTTMTNTTSISTSYNLSTGNVTTITTTAVNVSTYPPAACPIIPKVIADPNCSQLLPKYDPSGCVSGYECTSVTRCPSQVMCQDNSSKPCYAKENYCYCEPCDTKLPPGCQKITDSFGNVRFVCSATTICPQTPTDISESCIAKGGSIVKKVDPAGCPFAYCDFSAQNATQFAAYGVFGYSSCPGEKQFAEAEQKCKSLNLSYFVSFEGGCKIPRCGQNVQSCPPLIENETEKTKADCESKGFELSKTFTPSGCPKLECLPNNYCMKDLPDEALSKCKQIGGEMVVNRDASGCIKFSNCVQKGDDRSVNVEPVKSAPDTTQLLGIATRLESLKISLNEMMNKTSQIAAYYESTNSPDAERYKRVSAILGTTIGQIDDIRTKIRDNVNNLSTDDLTKIKRDIVFIKEVTLKDILYLMLSTNKEVSDIGSNGAKNCGSDSSCFSEAFRMCSPATFKPSGENGPSVELVGLSNGNCIVNAKMPESSKIPASMTCKIKDYALGISGPDDLLPFCSGPLADMLKGFGGAALTGVASASFPPAGGGPGGCKTIRDCAKYCYGNYDDCVSWTKDHPLYGNMPSKDMLKSIADGNYTEVPVGTTGKFILALSPLAVSFGLSRRKGINKNISIGLLIAVLVVVAFFGTSQFAPTVTQPTPLPTIKSAQQASDTVISVSANIDDITASLDNINKILT